MGQPNYVDGFQLRLQPHMMGKPLMWRRGRMVFVNSMSDLFHGAVPVSYIKAVFRTMAAADQHQFQVLTKRPERMAMLSANLEWAPNIWAGVSVESDRYLGRIEALRSCGARVKFLSLEPLLGPVDNISLQGIDWVIVGGESGPGARPMQPEWVRSVRDKCVTLRVPFFFKQWGGVNKKLAGRDLDGRTWDEMPEPWAGRAGI
jgi:protein gp37